MEPILVPPPEKGLYVEMSSMKIWMFSPSGKVVPVNEIVTTSPLQCVPGGLIVGLFKTSSPQATKKKAVGITGIETLLCSGHAKASHLIGSMMANEKTSTQLLYIKSINA